MVGNLSVEGELAIGSTDRLKPTFDADGDQVQYLSLDSLGEIDDFSAILETLTSRRILDQESVNRVITCPCESDNLSFRLSCPACGSVNTDEATIIEHTVCGCVRPRAKFENRESIACPECAATIESLDDECERMGTIHYCQECGERSDTLEFSLDCPMCGRVIADMTGAGESAVVRS